MVTGIDGPHANRDDVDLQMLIAQEDCIGLIADTTDPLVDPSVATLEGFPNGTAKTCKLMWLVNESGEPFYSTDQGGSYVALGGTASNSVILSSLTNRSGATRQPGDVVLWDFTNALSIKATTTRNDRPVAGIWRETTGALQEGSMVTRGIATVSVDGSVDIGDRLITATTAGLATAAQDGENINGFIGYALESIVGAGSILVAVDITQHKRAAAKFSYDLAQNTSGPTYTTGADRTVPLNTEVYDYEGIASVGSNQVTISEPGVFTLRGSAAIGGPSATSFTGYLFLYDVTNAIQLGVSNNLKIVNGHEAIYEVEATVEVNSSIAVELRVRTTGNTVAAAAANIAGKTERYASLVIERYTP